jgi:hypothetical protein
MLGLGTGSVKKGKLFSFASGGEGTARAAKTRTVRVPKLTDPADVGPWFIRGIKAGSKDEYWTSLFCEWLEKTHGFTWEYQYPVHGGRRRRGGNVIDFVIRTPGKWTMLEPKGRYWHTGHREDEQEMRDIAREKRWNLVEWFTDEYKTKEELHSFLRGAMHV